MREKSRFPVNQKTSLSKEVARNLCRWNFRVSVPVYGGAGSLVSGTDNSRWQYCDARTVHTSTIAISSAEFILSKRNSAETKIPTTIFPKFLQVFT